MRIKTMKKKTRVMMRKGIMMTTMMMIKVLQVRTILLLKNRMRLQRGMNLPHPRIMRVLEEKFTSNNLWARVIVPKVRSVGAATGRMNEMRKSSNNKLHLPRSSVVPNRACIRLVPGKRNDSVMVVGGGVVGIYTVKSRRADRPADKQKASRGAKYVEFRLPSLPDLKIAPEPLSDIKDLNLDPAENEDSQWNLKKPQQVKEPGFQGTETSIPQAEIESNAPYQPFHTDSRVGIHVCLNEQAPLPSPSVSALLSPQASAESVLSPVLKANVPWAFGGRIKTASLNIYPPQDAEDSIQSLYDHRALPQSAIERITRFPDDSEDSEQIVITTRARRSARSNSDAVDADGEGFFEDDLEFLDFASQRV